MPTTRAKLEGRLYAVAQQQQGYFTAQQAIKAGYHDSIHPYHVRQGNWFREGRGIYRLVKYPLSLDSHYVPWSLWSRNKKGVPQGVFSHVTALSMYDLSDANPAKIHMTVPPGFRRHSKIPKILVLHKGILSPADLEEREGYRVTRPIRTVYDLLRGGSTSTDIIRQALEEGFARGLITRKEIEVLPAEFPAEKYLFKGLIKKG
ncbi:MAG: type IV toxin-antitoxin system AbiEi family antitoxin domain-containing protein [Chitinivibrionales bacterium]|nr:type IV toxin-antitoxin system AbiEi family antitoxin domain-containing protein [Chitinivibrionales bacterium]